VLPCAPVVPPAFVPPVLLVLLRAPVPLVAPLVEFAAPALLPDWAAVPCRVPPLGLALLSVGALGVLFVSTFVPVEVFAPVDPEPAVTPALVFVPVRAPVVAPLVLPLLVLPSRGWTPEPRISSLDFVG